MTAPVISVICAGCKQAIDDRDGILECDRGLAGRRERERRRIQSERGPLGIVDMDDLLNNPVWEDVPWEGWHYRCDQRPDLSSYWIAVERIRSLADLFDWIGHLSEKSWIECTTWHNAIRAMASHGGPLRIDEQYLGKRTP